MLFVNVIEEYWRELLLNICQPIYKLIVYLYELFEVIGTAEILTNDTISILYNRVGLILGLYMMFRITFSFIQMLVNPDYITDKEKGIGNIAKKAFLVIVLLAIVPFVFNKAFEFQNFIVGANDENPNVIAKLIFPSEIVKGDNFGATLSSYLFSSFYRYNDGYQPQTTEDACYLLEDNKLQQVIISTKGNVGPAKYCLIDTDDYKATYRPDGAKSTYYKISFTWNGVFAILVGLVVCYTLITYVLYVGARVIQLAFFRIISPMAILGYLSPKKDGMFEKWLKMCVTTYLDLFIRMGIIYFVVFIIYVIIGSENGIAISKPFDDMWIVNIVMILALLIFAKKAPELLKELFPKGGAASLGFGLKSPKKMLDDMAGGKQLWNATKRTAGFGLGAVAGGAIGFLGGRGAGRVSGLFGGMTRGAFNGAKKGNLMSNLKGVGTKQAQINKQKIDWKNNNSTWSGRMSQRMANAFGYAGVAEGFENQMAEYDKELNVLNAKSSAYKEASGSVGKMEDRATSQLDTKTFKPGQIYQRNLQQRRRNYKAISEAMSNGDVATAKNIAISELTRARDERDEKLREYKQKFNNGEISKEEYATGIAYVGSAFKKSQQTIMDINNGTYNAAQASADMTDVFTETRNEYITQSLQDASGDVVIRAEYDHIQDVVNHADNKEAFAKFKNSSNGKTYDAMDSFASEAKGANTALSSDIYRAQTAKDTIAKSEAKKAADADRSAVGGHSGGKK